MASSDDEGWQAYFMHGYPTNKNTRINTAAHRIQTSAMDHVSAIN
jgi:hypothetical protein